MVHVLVQDSLQLVDSVDDESALQTVEQRSQAGRQVGCGAPVLTARHRVLLTEPAVQRPPRVVAGRGRGHPFALVVVELTVSRATASWTPEASARGQ